MSTQESSMKSGESPNANVIISTNHYNPKGAGMLFATITLVGARMGSGTIGIPFAMNNIGYICTA